MTSTLQRNPQHPRQDFFAYLPAAFRKKNQSLMNKSRVRLGPYLLAQTTPTPAPKSPKFFKTVGLTVLVVAAILLVRANSQQVAKNPAGLPKDESVLGAEAPVESDFYVYEVEAGDTFFSLSQKFQVNWEEMANLNNLQEPFALERGQKLKVPHSSATRQQRFYDNLKKKIYAVEQGDSFVGIAQKLNISVTDLLRANPDLQSPDFIRVGQILHLP